MKIACLGWGSLIWNPKELLTKGEWFNDGPYLPIEFARKSNDGRLTLVITKDAEPIQTLWVLMNTENLEIAKRSLMVREDIKENNLKYSIGSITINEETNDELKKTIKVWASEKNLDAVIWTNLKTKFRNVGETPTIEEAILHLNSLDKDSKSKAEEYIRKAPKQVDTKFRQKFQSEFGWNYEE